MQVVYCLLKLEYYGRQHGYGHVEPVSYTTHTFSWAGIVLLAVN